MKIKVCGITDIEQMQELQRLGVDYCGMIFYEGSKRFAGKDFESKKSEVRSTTIKKVGVFVNAEFDTILKAIEDYDLHAVQLHGDETDEFCMELMGKVKVVKAFRLTGEENIYELTEPFQNACHYFLFDTAGGGREAVYGGTGRQFDWQILNDAKIGKPVFLSGCIGPEDTEKIETFQHPYFYAVDVNSRFETEPGIKDIKKVEIFLKEIHHE